MPAAPPPPPLAHGINLGPAPLVNDCSSMIFADLMLSAPAFQGFPHATGPVPGYSAAGWPTRVDAASGPTMTFTNLNGHMPAGTYTLTAKGKGQVRLGFNFDGQFWRDVDLDGSGASVPLVLPAPREGDQGGVIVMASDPADPVRDVRLWLPGQAGKTFNKAFLDSLAPFNPLRFMDWSSANGSTWVNWADRAAPGGHFSLSEKHAFPYETQVELCNTLHKDPWVNIPPLASDDFIRQMARLWDGLLEPGRTIWLEYANEVWASGNAQAAQFQGRMAAPDWAPRPGGWEGIAWMDGHATSLFKSSLKPGRACKVVLARQAYDQQTLRTAMAQYKADGHTFDVISCAGYFSTKADLDAAAAKFATDPKGAVDDIFAGMPADMAEAAACIAWYKAQADAAGVPFVCYEAGQGIAREDDRYSPLLFAVARDQRYYGVYRTWFGMLPPGTTVNWFNDCGTFSKYGTWGHKEYTTQDPAQAPKWRAIWEAASAAQAAVVTPVPVPVVPPVVTPPPPLDALPRALLDLVVAMGQDGFVKLGPDGSGYVIRRDPANAAGYIRQDVPGLAPSDGPAGPPLLGPMRGVLGVIAAAGFDGYVYMRPGGTGYAICLPSSSPAGYTKMEVPAPAPAKAAGDGGKKAG